jgi:light-regulated signal transduction histidine kinase (bacteriophytochrome)
MNEPHPDPVDVGNPTFDASPEVLSAIRWACSHDLPTKVAVIAGLLEKLGESEVDRLSNDGFEYVHRLRHAVQESTGIVQFLKEAVKLSSCIPKSGRVDLRDIVKELRLKARTFVDDKIVWSADLSVPFAFADAAKLLDGLSEMLMGLTGPERNVRAIHWRSRADAGGVVLDLEIRGVGTVPVSRNRPPRQLVLGKARLRHLGIEVEPLTPASRDGFGLRFPSEAS